MSRPTARSVAHDVLLRVARDEAWAERVLSTALERTGLERRDRALATELVYGTLRHQRWLDFLLAGLARKPLSKLPTAALMALRLTAYQIVGSRVPDYSAVNEGVALVRRRHAHLSGVANGILRGLARLNEAGRLPDPADTIPDAAEALAVRYSHPSWLVGRVMAQLGEAETRAWCEANNEPPRISLRVNTLRTTREALIEVLQEAGVEVTVPEGFPEGLLIKGGAIEELPGYADGWFLVQDFAAQLVGRLAAPRSGERWLDACAAPGGKTTHLAELMGDEGQVVAVDIHRGKTRLIAANAERLGLGCVWTGAVDAVDGDALRGVLEEAAEVGSSGANPPASAPAPTLVQGVLLDAPCSGTGTLRRNPELRWRLTEVAESWHERQDHLLASVAQVLAPGGVLVYAVCSILPEEGEQPVERFLAAHPGFELERPKEPALQPYLTPDGALRTWPHLHGADGFFAARLRRRAESV